MSEWFQSLSLLEQVFLFTGVFGTFLFLIRVVLMFMGMGDHDVDGGGDLDHGDFDSGGGDLDHGDLDADGGDLDHADSDAVAHNDPADGVADMMSFKLLSFQGLTGFFMMFGVVGMAISRAQLGGIPAILGGTVAGLFLVWVADRLFRFVGGLQSSGTMSLKNALNEEGTVYLTIPKGEPGKVRIHVQGRLRVLGAVSEDNRKISTDDRVRVVGVVNDNVLVVKKI